VDIFPLAFGIIADRVPESEGRGRERTDARRPRVSDGGAGSFSTARS